MQLDLNLLTALDALLEEGSVTGAAARLHVTPPAMSRTLARIRLVTGDPILVRTGRHMTPTVRALEMREEVHALVVQAHAVLAPDRELRLPVLTRTFTLMCHDAITVAIGPALISRVRTQAPGVVLRLLAEPASDSHDLRRGHVDLEISSASPSSSDLHHETVSRHRMMLAVRSGHPLANGEMTAGRFADADHLTVSRRGRLEDHIDARLAGDGLRRRVVATLPTTGAALDVVRSSDLVVAVVDSVGPSTLQAGGVRMLELPYDLPPVPLNLLWHRRHDSDRAHAWLREEARRALRRTMA